jgi:seryl-tRNA synthetase
LRAKTVEINSELNIYRNKESLLSDAGVGSGLSVLRQWKEVEQEANQMNREELRQEQMLHDLKARKEKLSEEIQQLMKNKQATDQLLKRWRKSKLTRINTIKEPQGNTDLHDILRTFHFLDGVAQNYSNNTGVSS